MVAESGYVVILFAPVSQTKLQGKGSDLAENSDVRRDSAQKVHPLPHLWVAATPSVLQRMARLLRKFLADRLQALSQTNVFLFLYANKTRILRAFFMVSGTWTSAASPAAFAKHSAAPTDIGSAAGTYSSL